MSRLEEYTELFQRYESEGPAKLSKEDWDWLLVNGIYTPEMIQKFCGGQVKLRFQPPVGFDAALLKEYAEVFQRYKQNPEGLEYEELSWLRKNLMFSPYMILQREKGILRGQAPVRTLPVQAPAAEPHTPVQAQAAEPHPPVQAPAAEPHPPVQAPAQALVQAPARRKPPQSNNCVKPKKPKNLHVPIYPPGPLAFNGRYNSPSLPSILGKPFSCTRHDPKDRIFPHGSLFVKPCKTMDDVWEKRFPDGGLDVCWSRKWDGHSVYLVFCKAYPHVTAYSSSGEELELRKIIDTLRAACVPALDDGEVIIVKAEMCTEVTTPEGVHETGHAHVRSNQDPYKKAENCTALLVFHCFEVVLITKGAHQFQTTLQHLCNFEGEALYSHDLSPEQHTTLLKKLLQDPARPNAFVRVCEWQSFRAHTLEYLAAHQAMLSTCIRENAWEGVVFWAAFGNLKANRCHLYINDGTNVRRNRMQFKWKDLIHPFFQLQSVASGVVMVCPWTSEWLHAVDSADPQQVHPAYRNDLLAHAANKTVLRAPVIKITARGKVQGVLQLKHSNVVVVTDFERTTFKQVENTRHEAACQRFHKVVEDNEKKKAFKSLNPDSYE